MSGDAVDLLELDDVLVARLRGAMSPPVDVAEGFPRHEDTIGMDGHERGALSFVVRVDGLVVGTCGTHESPRDGADIEVGWGLVESARGRGVGTAAVGALLAEISRRFPRSVLLATTQWDDPDGCAAPVSAASEAILRRAGFAAGPVPATLPGERAWRREPQPQREPR